MKDVKYLVALAILGLIAVWGVRGWQADRYRAELETERAAAPMSAFDMTMAYDAAGGYDDGRTDLFGLIGWGLVALVVIGGLGALLLYARAQERRQDRLNKQDGRRQGSTGRAAPGIIQTIAPVSRPRELAPPPQWEEGDYE